MVLSDLGKNCASDHRILLTPHYGTEVTVFLYNQALIDAFRKEHSIVASSNQLRWRAVDLLFEGNLYLDVFISQAMPTGLKGSRDLYELA